MCQARPGKPSETKLTKGRCEMRTKEHLLSVFSSRSTAHHAAHRKHRTINDELGK